MRPRTLVLGTCAVLVLGPSLGALAWWKTAGTGTGSAATGTTIALTATGTTAAALLPGGPASAVTVAVTNPNAYAVTLQSVALGGTVTASAGCTPTGFSFTPGASGAGVTLPAGATTSVPLPAAAALDLTSPAACMGATFTIPLTLAVTR